MTWCEAEVVGTRTVESGRDEYRMHYVGWKKNWDEWVARDSGRIRQVSSGSKQPSPAKTPGGTKSSLSSGSSCSDSAALTAVTPAEDDADGQGGSSSGACRWWRRRRRRAVKAPPSSRSTLTTPTRPRPRKART